MTIILHDHDHTMRVGRVPLATVLDLAGQLPEDVRLRIRPDEHEYTEDGDPTVCDECGAAIPAVASTEINRWHTDSCSLYPANVHDSCPHCGRTLQPVAFTADVWGCASCRETWHRPQVHDPGFFGLAVALAREMWNE